MRDPAKGHDEQAYGDAVADATKATVADHSWIGSVTKTVFATAVLQQVAAGRLALMDTVQTLDPELAAKYPAIGALTVSQLLGMVSGIPDLADAAIAADHAKSFTRDDDIALGLSLGAKHGDGRCAQMAVSSHRPGIWWWPAPDAAHHPSRRATICAAAPR